MFGSKGVRNERTADSIVANNGAYGMKSAYAITLVLSFLLWWAPGIGQAAAGFLGGRKAGSAARGLATGILAVATVFALSMAFGIVSGYLPEELSIGYAIDYFASFVKSVNGVSEIHINPYALLLAFSIVGGMLSTQARKEAAALATATAEVNRRRHRSVELHALGRSPGFESYESCLSISVNNMNPVNQPRIPEPADAVQVVEDVPPPEPVSQRKSHVTSTVDMSASPSTATSAEDNPFVSLLKKSDRKTDATDCRDQSDDFEYI